MTQMKCIIRGNLDRMGISVRKLAEQAETIPGAPSYSTIDNFIRKGTGHLDTAWAITKLMGLTLNDNFIDDPGKDAAGQDLPVCSTTADTALKAIITAISKIGKIERSTQVAEILLAIGKEITPLGYDAEAGSIINMGTEYITMLNKEGGNGDE